MRMQRWQKKKIACDRLRRQLIGSITAVGYGPALFAAGNLFSLFFRSMRVCFLANQYRQINIDMLRK